jgi:hypothetical protein
LADGDEGGRFFRAVGVAERGVEFVFDAAGGSAQGTEVEERGV